MLPQFYQAAGKKKDAEGKKRGEKMERTLGKCSRPNGRGPIVVTSRSTTVPWKYLVKPDWDYWLGLLLRISGMPEWGALSSRSGKVFISLDL